MTTDPSSHIGENRYSRTATCDRCAESASVRLADPNDGNSPYICEACDAQIIRATNAAALVLAHELGHTLANIDPPTAAPNTWRIAELMLAAYLEVESEQGYAIVLATDVAGVVDEIDRLNQKLSGAIVLTRGIPSAPGTYGPRGWRRSVDRCICGALCDSSVCECLPAACPSFPSHRRSHSDRNGYGQ